MAVYINGVKVSDDKQNAFGNQVGGKVHQSDKDDKESDKGK
jgi:hypothetical protein